MQPPPGSTDAVIVNTCAVTAEAVRQARQAIRRARRERPDAKIIVTGCAAQIDPGALRRDGRGRSRHRQSGEARRPRPSPGFGIEGTERVAVNDIMSVRETAAHLIDGFGYRARAYVQIQNGCDHRCTFCIIPFGRGPSRSVPAGEVVAQVRRLVEKRLCRDRADRRRHHRLRRRSARRDDARQAGAQGAQAGAGAAAPAALLDRLGRGRSAADRGDRRGGAADAASASVAAVRRRPDPEAHEAAARPRRLGRVLRGDAPRPARHRVRRRSHRRLPHRDRGDVRELAVAGRRLRADLPACVSLFGARRHAGRAHAAGSWRGRRARAPASCATRASPRSSAISTAPRDGASRC